MYHLDIMPVCPYLASIALPNSNAMPMPIPNPNHTNAHANDSSITLLELSPLLWGIAFRRPGVDCGNLILQCSVDQPMPSE